MSVQHSLFINAYIGCLLWAGTDDNGEPLHTTTSIICPLKAAAAL